MQRISPIGVGHDDEWNVMTYPRVLDMFNTRGCVITSI